MRWRAGQDAPRGIAPVLPPGPATAACWAVLASSAVSVRSGARNRSFQASDLRPSPACSPARTLHHALRQPAWIHRAQPDRCQLSSPIPKDDPGYMQSS